MGRVAGLAPSVYRQLLRVALPRDLRRRYLGDMVRVFTELLRDARASGGVWAVFGVWRRAVSQTIGGGVRERLRGYGRGARGPGKRNRAGRSPILSHLAQDFRFALRMFARQPGFAVTAIGILALGIGATTAIFSVVDGVVLRRLPYPDPGRLIYFDQGSHTFPDYQEWLERLGAFESIVAVLPTRRTMLGQGRPQQIRVAQITANVIPTFGGSPTRGRLITEDDTQREAPVAVLSFKFWTREFGGDESIEGRSVQLDGMPYEIVGVMRPGFDLPRRFAGQSVDVWTPLNVRRAEYQRRGLYVLRVAGRLRNDATLETARAQMATWEEFAAEAYPESNVSPSGNIRRIPLLRLRDAETVKVRDPLFMLMGAVGLMLLIACVNVANLLLARGADRGRELAVRVALGGSRGRIASQLLTESVVLALAGAVAGLGVAYLGVSALSVVVPDNMPRFHEVGVDLRVLAFAFASAIVTGVGFGIAPAYYASRTNVSDMLKDASGKSSAGRGHVRLKGVLVASEIALALMLSVGAGLLFNSFVRLTRVDPGFEPQNVLAVPLTFGRFDEFGGTDQGGARMRLIRELMDRIGGVPGVQSVSGAAVVPFAEDGRCCMMSTSTDESGSDSVRVVIHPSFPGLFETLGMPLVAGRALRASDVGSAANPVLITRAMAERFFDGESPLGQSIIVGRRRPEAYTVIGLVDDPKFWSLSRDEDFDIFIPFDSVILSDFPFMHLAVRTAGPIEGLPDQLRETIWSLAPDMPLPEIFFLSTRIDESVTGQRLLSTLLLVFSCVAVVLAAGGIYGTMLYAVSQRSHEFGIRMALGADTTRIVGEVLRHGMVLTVIGIGFGLAGAVALSRVLESLVFGITAHDIPTYGAVTALLGTVAVAACYLPARKAARMDPMETLRGE